MMTCLEGSFVILAYNPSEPSCSNPIKFRDASRLRFLFM